MSKILLMILDIIISEVHISALVLELTLLMKRCHIIFIFYVYYQNIPFDLDVLEDKNYKINYCITVDVDENTKEKIERELDFISKF